MASILHPIDTQEAYEKSDKGKIYHLGYHLNYNQYGTNERNGKYEAKKLVDVPISKELIKLAESIDKQRQQAFLNMFSTNEIRILKAKSISKLVHGLGTAHVRETSITIHPVYGIPYIPASSVKGVVRNWYVQAYLDGDERKLEEDPFAATLFGTQEREGIVQFYDILLYEGLKLEKDILAVHFKEYYGGSSAATDTQNTLPVSFWTVQIKEAKIYVTLSKQVEEMPPTEKVLDVVAEWVSRALTEFGIGSKTALGYGLFSEVVDGTEEFVQLKEQFEKQKEKFRKQQLEQQRMEEEKKKQQERENQLASMSDEERLVYEIESLTEAQADIEKSKTALFEQIVAQQNKAAAEKLKAYWEKTNQWKVKKGKKQYEKVEAIKKLLN